MSVLDKNDPERKPEAVAETGRTPLGRRLKELRKGIVASGAPLLDWGDLAAELAWRRGRTNDE